jgi:hypothetical protein
MAETKCGVRIVEGLDDAEPLLCERAAGHDVGRHESTSVLKFRIDTLTAALRGMLEYCSCQGRGYRSWGDGRVVKPCSSVTCGIARNLLGIPDTEARYGFPKGWRPAPVASPPAPPVVVK